MPIYTNIKSYYQTKVANSAVPTFNDKSLRNIPLPTTTWTPTEQKQVYCAWTACTQPILEALAIYLHSCTGFPVTETWYQAIAKGNYTS